MDEINLDENALDGLTDDEILSLYSDMVESGESVLIAKCNYGCSCPVHPPQYYTPKCVPCGTYC